MSAYYIPHPPSTEHPFGSTLRQEGFKISELPHTPASPHTPFDHPSGAASSSNGANGNAMNGYFNSGSHGVFPSAFRKFADSNAIDFSDTLATMMAADPADDQQHQQPSHHLNQQHAIHPSLQQHQPSLHYQQRQPQHQQPQQQHASSFPMAFGLSSHNPHQQQQQQQHQTLALNHGVFDLSAFPSHLSSFRGTPDSGIGNDSPAANQGYFPDILGGAGAGSSSSHLAGLGIGGSLASAASTAVTTPSSSAPQPILPRLNTMRTSSPPLSSLGSPGETLPNSPFSPSHLGAGGSIPAVGRPSSSSGPGAIRSTSRSRSRSRAGTAASAAARPRVRKSRTMSISSTTSGVAANASPASAAAPASQGTPPMVIPNPNAGTSSGATTAGTPQSWMFSPGTSQATTSFSLGGESFPAGFAGPQNAPATHPMEQAVSGSIDQTTPTGEKSSDDPSVKPTPPSAILSEKRRRRRESHNAVERRRRDNINEKINELATLIPEFLLNDGNPAPAPAPASEKAQKPSVVQQSTSQQQGDSPEESTNGQEKGIEESGNGTQPGAPGSQNMDEDASAQPKANKGVILRKSVDYIKYLQQLVRHQAQKNRDLEAELVQYRGPSPGNGLVNGGNMVDLSDPHLLALDPSASFGDFLNFAGGNLALGGDFANNAFHDLGSDGQQFIHVKEEGSDGGLGMLGGAGALNMLSPSAFTNASPGGLIGLDSPLSSAAMSYANSLQHPTQLSQAPTSLAQASTPQTKRRRASVSSVHMDGSPSAQGSGSNVSDIEEEEEPVENNDDTEPERGRNRVRGDSSGRFSHSGSKSFDGRHAGGVKDDSIMEEA